jgi:hypothetical protein
VNQINYRKLAEIFTDTLHHIIVAEIIRVYSTNKLNAKLYRLMGNMKHALKKFYELRLPLTFPPKSVKINGNEITLNEHVKSNSWSYDGTESSTIINTGLNNVTDELSNFEKEFQLFYKTFEKQPIE